MVYFDRILRWIFLRMLETRYCSPVVGYYFDFFFESTLDESY